jgi:hypothetical protein
MRIYIYDRQILYGGIPACIYDLFVIVDVGLCGVLGGLDLSCIEFKFQQDICFSGERESSLSVVYE